MIARRDLLCGLALAAVSAGAAAQPTTSGPRRKLSRTHAALLDALNRHRGKGQQKVTVEHVHVHSGGQAIVGNVNGPGGGDAAKSEEQSHAKQIGYAPEPPMPSPDQERQALPVACNAERPMPDARRTVAGSAEG